MWCERVLRNVAEDVRTLAGRELDYVDIEWDECKSVLKKRTRGRELVNVLLPASEKIRHGDVVFDDGRRAVLVNVVAAPMIVVKPPDAQALAVLALELGNLHRPTQIGRDELILPACEEAMEVIQALGFHWTVEQRRFEPQALIGSPAIHVAEEIQVMRPSSNVVPSRPRYSGGGSGRGWSEQSSPPNEPPPQPSPGLPGAGGKTGGPGDHSVRPNESASNF